MTFLLVLVKSKYFWIGLVAFILLLVIIKKWSNIRGWIKRSIQPEDIDLTPEERARLEANSETLSSERKSEMEAFAQELYAEIQGASYGTSLYEKLLKLSDTEVKYLSKYYRKHISGGTYLYQDVDEEWFSPFTDIDGRVMARLAKVGEKA